MMDRRQAVSTLLSHRGDGLLVTGLGSATWDAAAAGDSDRNFYLWGGMGGAVCVGLGLALARPDFPVLVLTGDGEMLMGLGGLSTVARKAPPNLSIAVLDNGRYGETGMQASATDPNGTAGVTDLGAVARACGIPDAGSISSLDALDEEAPRLFGKARTMFRTLKIMADDPPRVLPERDGVLLKARFRAALPAKD
jgi:thiamine pyrophosphate-dependent acetolactate synthase large subunit-like protein